MDVRFSPELEAKLADIAARTGRQAGELIQAAVSRLVDEEYRFLDSVEEGFDSIDRGEYVTHEEVGARLERLLRS